LLFLRFYYIQDLLQNHYLIIQILLILPGRAQLRRGYPTEPVDPGGTCLVGGNIPTESGQSNSGETAGTADHNRIISPVNESISPHLRDNGLNGELPAGASDFKTARH
jgi:hypothetical protein